MAKPPTIDQMRAMTLDELIALRTVEGYEDIASTPDYQTAIAEKPGKQGDSGVDMVTAAASAARQVGAPPPVPAEPEPGVAKHQADVKAKDIGTKADNLVSYVESGGQGTPPPGASDPVVQQAAEKKGASKGQSVVEGLKSLFDSMNMPDWVKAEYGSHTAAFTDKEKGRIVDEYNKLVPPAERIIGGANVKTRYDAFIAANPTPTAEGKAAFTFAGLSKAEASHTFQLPDGSDYTVRQSELEAFTPGSGKSTWEPAKISMVQDFLNVAQISGLYDKGGRLLWEVPAMYNRLTDFNFTPATPAPDLGPVSARVLAPGEAVAKYGKDGKVDPRLPSVKAGKVGATNTAEKSRAAAENKAGILKFSTSYAKNFKDTDGDVMMAYLKTVNPEVYSHVVGTDGKIKPESRQWADAAAQVFGDSGVYDVDNIGLYDTGSVSDLTTWIDKSGGGAQGSTIMLPDPLAIDQSMRDLYNAWFGMDPTQQEYDTFREGLFDKMRGTLPGVGQRITQDVSPAAQLRNAAETSPQYATLFANKPAGISADDYVNSNRQAVGSILGNDMSAGAVRAGQLTGKTQTAVGAAAGSADATQNSTFMERLARAAQAASAAT